MNGWIQLHRQLLDNPLWTCEPFSRGQAWVDLLLLANHKESFFYKRNIKITVKRGQLARSEKELADRWNWSRSKVRKFLKDLEKERQLIQQKNNVCQILTINNYDEFQKKEPQDVQQKNRRKTAEEPQKDTYNNDNNINNENKESEPRARTREEFEEMTRPLFAKFDAMDSYAVFCEYWCTPNQLTDKMRWEEDQYFNPALKVRSWIDRDKRGSTGKSTKKEYRYPIFMSKWISLCEPKNAEIDVTVNILSLLPEKFPESKLLAAFDKQKRINGKFLKVDKIFEAVSKQDKPEPKPIIPIDQADDGSDIAKRWLNEE